MNNVPSSLVDRALFLLEAGFHVIPLGGYGETPNDYFIRERFGGDAEKAREAWPKTPRISWKAFQTEAPSEQTVRHWWSMWPNSNIGIATGSLVVVDGDSEESCAWIKMNLTPTPWRVKTGKGYHFYFAANPMLEIRNSADPLAKIDTRGMGGYVVAGGSRHSNGSYYTDELPQDMGDVALCDLPMLAAEDIEKIKNYRHETMDVSKQRQPGGNLVGFDARRYSLPATGEPVAEGGRNNAAASLAGKYLHQGISLRDVQSLLNDWNNSNEKPLSTNELNTTVASVARTHIANNPGAAIPLVASTAPPAAPKTTSRAFPAHLLDVPGLVGDVARYMNRTAIKPQPVLALGAALAFCGTIMGRKVQTVTGLRTNIYVIGVADSGSGKENARVSFKRLLRAAGRPNMVGAEDLASDAGLFAAVHREPSCCLLLDEWGRFIESITGKRAASHQVAIASMLIKFTGSANNTITEKFRAENIDKDARVIVQPNLSIYGTTVPSRMFKAMTMADVIDGFFPRLIVMHSDDPDPWPQEPGDTTPEPELIDLIRMWIARPTNAYPTGGNIADLTPNPLKVDMSFEASQHIDAFEMTNRGRRAATRGTGIDSVWARAREHALSLALIRACGRDFDRPIIQLDDAEWACELVTHSCERSIAEVQENVSENDYEAVVKRVAAFIRSKGQVKKSVLTSKFKAIKAFDFEGILKTLTESRDIEMALGPAPVGGIGRPAMMVTWRGGE